MSISSRKMVRGCGLVGGVLLLLLLLSPTMSYRLQGQTLQQQPRISSSSSSFKKSSPQNNHHQNQILNNNGSRKSGGATAAEEAPWPPRIPLWSFLPSPTPLKDQNHYPNSVNVNHVATSALANSNAKKNKPSKRESSFVLRKGLMNLEPSLTSEDNHIFEEDEDLFDEDRSDPDNWLVNLKRSTAHGEKQYEHENERDHTGFKRSRVYDVPQIECPPADDGMERFACPTPDKLGRYPCVDDHVLCDGFVDCPGREDEDRQACMFYKTTKAHLDVLADALLRWARGRR